MSKSTSSTLGAFKTPIILPVKEFDFVNQLVSTYSETNQASWYGFASAWNATAYRLRAAHEHGDDFISSIQKSTSPEPGDDFISSIQKSTSPEPNERFHQDHNLFIFAVSAISAIECFFFAAHCFGALKDPTQFQMSKAEDLKFSPRKVHSNFQKAFPNHSLTLAMSKCLASSKFDNLLILRNVLAHRGTPPRLHSLGNTADTPSAIPGNLADLASSWQYTFSLTPNCLNPYIDFLDQTIERLIIEAAGFAKQKL